MIQFDPTNDAEFARLNAHLLADIGVAGPGEGIHPSQLRRLPRGKHPVRVLMEAMAKRFGHLASSSATPLPR